MDRKKEDEMPLLESVIVYIRLKIADEKAQNKELAEVLHMQAYMYKQKQLWEKCYKLRRFSSFVVDF